MWRKNMRDNSDGSLGVDLNRNYGHQWGVDDDGSSGLGNAETYRGKAVFSEPETQAIRDLCKVKRFSLAMNYHSYGNLLIHPWGMRTKKQLILFSSSDLPTKQQQQITTQSGAEGKYSTTRTAIRTTGCTGTLSRSPR